MWGLFVLMCKGDCLQIKSCERHSLLSIEQGPCNEIQNNITDKQFTLKMHSNCKRHIKGKLSAKNSAKCKKGKIAHGAICAK